MRSIWFKVGLIFLYSISISVFSQGIEDLSNVNIDDLSDSQIEAYAQRAFDAGFSIDQLEQIAKQRGVSAVQIAELRRRMAKIQAGKSQRDELIGEESRLRDNYALQERFDALPAESSTENGGLAVFGQDIFESAHAFEPGLNVATPENYILGAGDQVIIDIYGASEVTYEKTISPDGKILVSGVGPIHLSGVSVVVAKNRVFNKLSSIYSGLRGSNPNTFMDLSLGGIKTIMVNVVGNVKRPGTYNLSSFATAFNALYVAGGPNKIGSMRDIDVMRSGVKIATLDIYKYFFGGDISKNPALQDGDVIVVKAFKNRVVYLGEVKRPAVYEFLENETFSDLVNISGGFNPEGYKKNVTIFRKGQEKKSLLTVESSDFGVTKLQSGDSIPIPPIPNEFDNRVQVNGAVKHPGFYELKEGMTLLDLLNSAKIDRDAYWERGNIIRLNDDLTLSNISFDLNKVISNEENYSLQKEDRIKISSLLEIKENRIVTLKGEVNNEGSFPFVEGMTAEDLITISGGIKPSADVTKVEVARRVSKDSEEFKTAIIFEYEISDDLGFNEKTSDFILEPYDLVTVKATALFRTQKTIKIEGEVMNPGIYTLESEEDRMSDLIARAGGLTSYAYPKGASLIRDLSSVNFKARVGKELETTGTEEGIFYRNKQLESLIQRDSVNKLNSELENKQVVGIQLEKALINPASKFNVVLQNGDIISVPKQLNTVRVRGEVLYPTRVAYDQSAGFREYISQAGGFSDNARAKKAYVVYSNGRAKRTKKLLFFKIYPAIEPGSDIFIPEKPEKRKLSSAEVLGITSGLASISLVIIQIINLTN